MKDTATGKDITVRLATKEDIDEICEIENVCFQTPWSRESLMYDMMENNISVYFVAEVEGHVAGYVGIWVIMEEAHINNVAVVPQYRQRNIGSSIIGEMIRVTGLSGVTAYTLEVRAGNEAAKRLYHKYGFRDVGLRKGYYQDNGEDAIIMWRTE